MIRWLGGATAAGLALGGLGALPNAAHASPISFGVGPFDRALDRLNEQIVESVQRSGLALLMTTRVRGRVAIRVSVCSHRTLGEDIVATFEAIARWGRLLNKKYSVRHERTSEMEALLCSSESYSSPTEVSAT